MESHLLSKRGEGIPWIKRMRRGPSRESFLKKKMKRLATNFLLKPLTLALSPQVGRGDDGDDFFQKVN